MVWDASQVIDRRKEYFEGLYGGGGRMGAESDDEDGENENEEVTVDEVLTAIRKLRNGKAAGVDVITGEMLKFAVNLSCGRTPTSDIAFHFNPRVMQRYMVRNSRISGSWGDEDTLSASKFPFLSGQPFLLEIFIGAEEFLVAVNGTHVCAFAFRVPLAKVTGIEVRGSVDVIGVDYKKLGTYPERFPENQTLVVQDGPREVLEDAPEVIMNTPVTISLPEGFKANWQLEVHGRVKILPHSFYVNLQVGGQYWPHPLIPLHLNPRFSTTYGEAYFVRNSWLEGGWGREERCPGFQFSPGSPFVLTVRRQHDHFSVWVDGKFAGEFKFRSGLEQQQGGGGAGGGGATAEGYVDKIDTLYVQGDVVVYGVYLDKQPRRMSILGR